MSFYVVTWISGFKELLAVDLLLENDEKMYTEHRGVQIRDARSLWLSSLVRWCLIFVGPRSVTCFMSSPVAFVNLLVPEFYI